MKKLATLSVKVPEQVHARIREVAAKYGVSIATVVRWALAAYLEAEGLPEAGRALEANDGE